MPQMELIRKTGKLATFGVLAWVVFVAVIHRHDISEQFANHPLNASIAAILALSFIAAEVYAAWGLVRRVDQGYSSASKVAAGLFSFSILLFVALAVVTGPNGSGPFSTLLSTWGTLWTTPWWELSGATFNPFPLLLPAQWAALHPKPGVHEFWLQLALACLAFNATYGIFTFSPALFASWQFFVDSSGKFSGTATFFNIGVILHVVAFFLLLRRVSWAWTFAAFIGIGCFVSGLILSLIPEPSQPNLVGIPDFGIGFFLHVGWYELGGFMPPIAYLLLTLAAFKMWSTQRIASSDLKKRDEGRGTAPKPQVA